MIRKNSLESSLETNTIHAGRFELQWQLNAPLVMGIVNVTPDSFSDGGQFHDPEPAIEHARSLIEAGADVLDIGGESTRPGAQAVDADQEWARVGPVLEELVRWQFPISLDTMKPKVMDKALEMGVDFINDVNGFRASGAAELLGQSEAAGIVMHMQGQPRTMQKQPQYQNVVQEVTLFLLERLEALVSSGTPMQSLLVDPGFGFGKTLAHNQALFQATDQFARLGAGVLIGVSRKRMIGEVTGRELAINRVAGSVAAALLAAQAGAAMVRVHDVRETVDALRMLKWTRQDCKITAL